MKSFTRPQPRAMLTLGLLAALVLAGTQTCVAGPKGGSGNLKDLADNIANRVQQDCAAHLPASGKHTVAVFKFCDQNYKYDPGTMGNLGTIAASLLQDAVRTKLSSGTTSGKYEVLDQIGIDTIFSATSVPQLGIFNKDVNNVRATGQKASIDVIVLTKFMFNSVTDVRTNYDDSVIVETTVIFPNSDDAFSMLVQPKDVLTCSSLPPLPPNPGGATPPPGPGGGFAPAIPPNVLNDPSRFDIEFFLRVNPGNPNDADPGVWQLIPLAIGTNPNTAAYGTFFLELDEARHRDQSFKIRLKYKGPRAVVQDPLAKDRIYAAAITIDGLDSFFHDDLSGKPKPKFVHPLEARKWILTPPGRELAMTPGSVLTYPAPYAWGADLSAQGLGSAPNEPIQFQKLGLASGERMKHGTIRNCRGAGHSIVDVRGFQNGPQFAESFVFKTGGTSVANLAGSVADVGEIKIYIFGEDLPLPSFLPQAAFSGNENAGIGTGVTLTNPVFKIGMRLESDPHEVFTVKYRYTNSKNPPPPGLTPVGSI